MNSEEIARNNHKNGKRCSDSVYLAFYNDNDEVPAPRSIDGKCGAVLAAEKVLTKKGYKDIDNFERLFKEELGSVKCMELLSKKVGCNNCVGISARIVDELITK